MSPLDLGPVCPTLVAELVKQASAAKLKKDGYLWHFSLIAGTSGDKRRKLTAFSCSYSATGGTRTRTRMAAPIEYEYEYRFAEYEYEFDAINTGDQREVSYLLNNVRLAKFKCSRIRVPQFKLAASAQLENKHKLVIL